MKELSSKTLARWHEFVQTRNAKILNEILAETVKFHSPFVWKPKDGKLMATAILIAATETFENFRYIREISENNQHALEFEAEIGKLTLRGIDLIEIGADGKITDFEVMVRPANALQILGMEMSKRLSDKGLI